MIQRNQDMLTLSDFLFGRIRIEFKNYVFLVTEVDENLYFCSIEALDVQTRAVLFENYIILFHFFIPL